MASAAHRIYDSRDKLTAEAHGGFTFQTKVQVNDIVRLKQKGDEPPEHDLLGEVMAVTGQDDDDIDDLQVDGTMRVCWSKEYRFGEVPKDDSVVLNIDDVEVVDRHFEFGDIVSRYTDCGEDQDSRKLVRQGMVTATKVRATVRLDGSRDVIENVDSSNLCLAFPYRIDGLALVSLEQGKTPRESSHLALASIAQCYFDVLVGFSDGAVCLLKSVPRSAIERRVEGYFPYAPRNLGKYLKHAEYIVGRPKKNRVGGTVLHVVPVKVVAKLLMRLSRFKDGLRPEVRSIGAGEEAPGGEVTQPEPTTTETATEGTEEADKEAVNGDEESTGDSDTETSYQTDDSIDPTKVGVEGFVELHPRCVDENFDFLHHDDMFGLGVAVLLAPDVVDGTRKPESGREDPIACPLIYPPWEATESQREFYKKAIGSSDAQRLLAQLKKRVGEVTELYTFVTVQWQDGTIEEDIASSDLFLQHHVQDFELFSNFYVTLENDSAYWDALADDDRWKVLKLDRSELGEEAEGIHQVLEGDELSCYDLVPAYGGDSFGIGDVVLHVPSHRSIEIPKQQMGSAPPQSASQAKAEGGGDVPEGMWACDVCTLQNPSNVMRCAACHTKRERTTVCGTTEGTWDCPQCTYINPMRHIVCEMCGAANLAGATEKGYEMHAAFLGCTGTELPGRPLGDSGRRVFGIVTSVDSTERTAKVNWVSIDKTKLQELSRNTKKEDGCLANTFGMVVGFDSFGRVKVKWFDRTVSTVLSTELIFVTGGYDDYSYSGDSSNPDDVVQEAPTMDWDDEDSKAAAQGGAPEGPAGGKGFIQCCKELARGLGGFISKEASKVSSQPSEPATNQTVTPSASSLETPPTAHVDPTEAVGGLDGNELEGCEPFAVVDSFVSHSYSNEPTGVLDMKRVQQEWKTFSKALPPGIYVRASESQPHLLKAIIQGPKHTPYYRGVYVFHLYLPPTYPHTPPKANIISNNIRLNPNLYQNGHICLSLLGTWDGYQTCEEWSPKSTLLQVLVSIQALVLNKEPYYNEAGYHNHIGTPEGRQNSRAYNEMTYILKIKHLTLTLRNLPADVGEEVKAHVRHHARYLVRKATEYVRKGREAPPEHPPTTSSTTSSSSSSSPPHPPTPPGDAGGDKLDKRMVQPEDLESGLLLNEDGLVLPLTGGLIASLRTTLPTFVKAVREVLGEDILD
eukprot:Sspe_Gene.40364::Locus_19490_Transcript_1_1_Confidence_1.000_Length_3661::g.40364::m.40364/K10581/UBE2O; ubiquitin-conjugating enzyme E2 O